MNLDDLEAPTFASKENVQYSNDNQYIEFTPTGLKKKDAGQSTIPFIDQQPLVTNPPTPLSGVGLMHRGSFGSGGFLAFKMESFDVVQHLEKIIKNIKF